MGLLLVVVAALLVGQAWLVGVTVDEPAHLLSAHLYWQGEDRLAPRDFPPLVKIVCGWVPGLVGIPVPRDHHSWAEQHEWPIAQEMMQRLRPQQIAPLFFWTRLPAILFPLLSIVLLFLWTREWFGPEWAWIAPVLFAFEPTALGHGALIKNDHAAAFALLWVSYAVWRYARQQTTGRALFLGGGVLAAVLAKMSLLMLVPLVPVLILACHGRRLGIEWRTAAKHVSIIFVLIYVGASLAAPGPVSRVSREQMREVRAIPEIGRWQPRIMSMFRVIPVPQFYWDGVVSLSRSEVNGSPVYFHGSKHPEGHRLYFLTALLIKSPVALLLLLLWAVVRLPRVGRAGVLTAALPSLLYVTLASLSSLQLGVRLILPALAPALVVVAGAAATAKTRSSRAIAYGLPAVAVAVSLFAYPNGIGFVNLLAGSPENAAVWIANSNLDWGQGLRDLADWKRRHQVDRLRLFYFGFDMPDRHFPDGSAEVLAPPWSDELVQSRQYQPQPGYYAISVNLLLGHFFEDKYRDYLIEFRRRDPVDTVAGSIFIYHIR